MTHPSNTEVSVPLPRREGLGVSLLIPTYNHACAHLVCELQKQCEEVQALLGASFNYEIIVADDGSTDTEAMARNAVIEHLPHCRYLDNEKNLGRAGIRNLLTEEACYKWLIFMDADAEVVDDDFVLNYVDAIKAHPAGDTFVGGILHPEECPSPKQSLRFRYEKAAEPRFTADRRQQTPYHNFRTFNFMIRRELCLRHPFDEDVKEYGYEDVLFGMELQADGATIVHIDNPLLNSDIEDNTTYLNKVETALRTLHGLEDRIGDFSPIIILKQRLAKLPGALLFTRALYKLCSPILRRHLLGAHPTLAMLTFYKFGYYLSQDV